MQTTRGRASVLLTPVEIYLGAGGPNGLARARTATDLDPTDAEVRLTLHVAMLGVGLLDWPATALPVRG
ncbi:hypothetical protein [Pseudonocardia abyssalis]|uniref:hypothetical protein n=1 Tax=Pseudonocardia abyssalis TaxID=2792008 RepID=UPI001C4A1573|nr:hypothetical protein [Pseudonocardia abyssalis]MBW0116165.1 hypothetical protein [Pseudonocardia abyssalis]